MGRVFLGILLGIVLVPLALLGWLKFGDVPVAVADPPLPQERLLTGMPLHARIDREMVQKPPILADEADLIAGAETYRDQCHMPWLSRQALPPWRAHVSRCAAAMGKA